MELLITGGRVIDPAQGRDGIFDVWVREGKIEAVEKSIRLDHAVPRISAAGRWVLPGLVDAHVHLREPGGEDSETIESGTRAAAAGGVTSVLAMANTRPPVDSVQQVKRAKKRIKEKAIVRVYQVGAVTRRMEGKHLTDIRGLIKGGCSALSDDGREIMDSGIFRKALELAKAHGVPIIDHCEDENLSRGGVMNESSVCKKLGFKGIPPESESIMVARAVYLSNLTGARIHLAHVSTKDSVDLVRRAKKSGFPISAETCPHYICLNDEAVKKYGTNAKMKPPLRSHLDSQALREGLADGTIDTIATDHAPHSPERKNKEFSHAPFGIIGLETSLSIVYDELILKKILSPLSAIKKMTTNPAMNFGLPAGSLSRKAAADITIFDPGMSWTAGHFKSRSQNSPFMGRKLTGKVTATIVGGRIVYQYGSFPVL